VNILLLVYFVGMSIMLLMCNNVLLVTCTSSGKKSWSYITGVSVYTLYFPPEPL